MSTSNSNRLMSARLGDVFVGIYDNAQDESKGRLLSVSLGKGYFSNKTKKREYSTASLDPDQVSAAIALLQQAERFLLDLEPTNGRAVAAPVGAAAGSTTEEYEPGDAC